MREFRIFGPPGTGKTTRLATRDIPRAVEKYGPDGVMVASFTKAAAKEIASRGLDVNPDMVGTLHSLCYHALGQPELTQKHLKEWNELHPVLALEGISGHLDESKDEMDKLKTKGDEAYTAMQIYRAKMIPRRLWRPSVQSFAQKWERWKEQAGLMDFTDLIEHALETKPIAPGNPRVMFLDEAQDFTPLQLALVRSWGLTMDWFILCGDDDQTIYRFAGASPEAFLNPPVEDGLKTVLKQSYRVPRAIHERATKTILKVKKREPKEYLPRNHDGTVIMGGSSYKYIEDTLNSVLKHAKNDRTVMLLASCSYMLVPILKCLRKAGVPFHNPYRRRRRDWNPLGRVADTGPKITSVKIIRSFIQRGTDDPYWDIQSLITWAKALKVGDHGLLYKTGKKALAALEQAVQDKLPGLHTSREVLSHVLAPHAIDPALNRDINWFQKNLLQKYLTTTEYPITVYQQHGWHALNETPKITIGTIHSVKGGEADVVYLFPDISQAAAADALKYPDARDALRRLFYVGMTRARETLVLMQPAVNQRRRAKALYMEM